MNYAKIYKRAIAIIIDFGLLFLVFTLATYLMKGVWLMSASDHLWSITDPICLVYLCIIILYFIVLEIFFWQTLGKRMMRIRIVPQTGKGKLTLKQTFIRLLLLPVDSFLLGVVGCISIIRSPSKQRIGDRLAKTIVVDKE